MVVSKLFKVLTIFVLFFFVSCEINDVDKSAKLLTIQELLNYTIGYDWFPYEFSLYKPNSSVTMQIDSLWKFKKYRFIVFVNPSCNCTETQKTFPSIIKSLKASNIPDSVILIYSMLNETYSHPFMHKFTVKILPSCFTEIDSTTSKYYSVVDTFELYRVKFPGKYRMEHIIAKSLED